MASTRSFLCVVSVAVALTDAGSAAQDVNAILRTVGTTIGADDLRCLTYSGSGYLGAVGQNFTPRDDWPRVELASHTRTVNFEAKSAMAGARLRAHAGRGVRDAPIRRK